MQIKREFVLFPESVPFAFICSALHLEIIKDYQRFLLECFDGYSGLSEKMLGSVSGTSTVHISVIISKLRAFGIILM